MKHKKLHLHRSRTVYKVSTTYIGFFDSQKETSLQVDASNFELGVIILQEGQPVKYASQSLNLSEVQYAHIEKEMYAVLFGCKHFHQCVYGVRLR
jgi:hypothetical protein